MTIGARFLNHRISILRQVRRADELGDDVLDDYGQPLADTDTVAADVAAGIQPKTGRELAAQHQAGAVLGDTRIYLLPRDITTADAIYHDPAACPAPIDLPAATYNLVAVRDAAGRGHHLEIDAKLVSNPQAAQHVAPAAPSYS